MVSVIITSFKEPATIGKCIKSIADKGYSGIEYPFQIIQISPDTETLDAGLKAAQELKLNIGEQFIQIVDPHKGKPFALNYGFKEAKGEIILLTDGDVYWGGGAVSALLKPLTDSSQIGGVTGQPIPQNDRNSYWGFLAHCFTAAADHKRKKVFGDKVDNYYVSKGKPFPLSGYIFAIRNLNLTLPDGVILDDSYISYKVFNQNFKLAYAPEATAFVKFPTTFTDYFKQRKRNLAGHIDLKKHSELKDYKNDRSIFAEMRYLLFPIAYAQSFKEFVWALSMYPLRGASWIQVFKNRLFKGKIMKQHGWDRTDSTK